MSLLKKINKGESRFVEFKAQLPKSETLAKSVIAFSNGGGGEILLGVDNSKNIIGIDKDNLFEISDKISNLIHDLCYPLIIPEIFTEFIQNKTIMVIKIFPGNLKPYYLKNKGKKKGTYVRLGSTNKLADKNYIFELERQRYNRSLDEEIKPEYLFEDLDLTPLKKKFKEYKNKDLNITELKTLKLIKEKENKIYPTSGLLILLGKYDGSAVDCARFKGTTTNNFIDRKEFTGDIFTKITQIENFLKNHLNLVHNLNGFQREEHYEIPILAIREAIVNALVHRDYFITGSTIKIALFDDILEITSPGNLPNSIDIETIFTERRSEVRNKVIARVMKELGYIEQWGTGIERIIALSEKYNLKTPILTEKGTSLQFIFYRENLKNTDKIKKHGKNTDKTRIKHGKNTEKRPKEHRNKMLNTNEKIILKYLKQNKRIKNETARGLTDLSNEGTRSLFKRLVEKGYIEKKGEKKGTYYILRED